MAPNTILARSVSWNRWCAWCTKQALDPLKPTADAVLAHVQAICATSTRPQGSVSAFRTTIRLLGQVPVPHFADINFNKLADSDQRAIRGAVRSHTTTAPHRDQDVDVARVLKWLRGECAAAEDNASHLLQRDVRTAATTAAVPAAVPAARTATTNTNTANTTKNTDNNANYNNEEDKNTDTNTKNNAKNKNTAAASLAVPAAASSSPAEAPADARSSVGADAATYRRLRNLALAAFAALVPSRPSELAGLCRSDVIVEVPPADDAPAGTRARRARLDQMLRTERFTLLAAGAHFDLLVALRKSKTDQLLRGIHKRLEHRATDTWSAARTVLLADLAGEALLASRAGAEQLDPPPKSTTATVKPKKGNNRATTAATSGAPLFFVSDPLARVGAALDKDTPSNVLGDAAEAATGVRSKARAWRASAASWLLTSGVDTETVAAAGGWTTTRALRLHYVRSTPLRAEVHRATLGAQNDQPTAAPETEKQTDGAAASSAVTAAGSAEAVSTADRHGAIHSTATDASAATPAAPSRRSSRRTAGKPKPFFSPPQ